MVPPPYLIDGVIRLLYLGCLALESRQLRQARRFHSEQEQAATVAQGMLAMLTAELQQRPCPLVSAALATPAPLPVRFAAVIEAMRASDAPAWIDALRHRWEPLLPLLWDVSPLEQEQAIRARLAQLAAGYGDEALPVAAPAADLLNALDRRTADLPELGSLLAADELTGLPGLAELVGAHARIQLWARHHRSPLSLAMLEFAADAPEDALFSRLRLRSFVHRLQTALPPGTQMSHWSPGRLVILLPNLGLAEALQRFKAFQHEASAPACQATFRAGLTGVLPEQPFAVAALEAWHWLRTGPAAASLHLDRAQLIRLARRRVLVVSQDRVLQQLITEELGHAGHRVSVCGTSEALWTELAAAPVDLILLEVHLGGESGFELLQRLRAPGPYTELPIVAMSANWQEKELIEAFESGASDFQFHPFSLPEMRARVGRFLR